MNTSPDAPISVVLLGFGLGGRVFHGPLIEAAEGLRLDAIVTSNPERAADAQRLFPHARVYATPEEAWSGGHDLAVVGTANVTHVPYASAALAAGLHVVVDKPIAPTASAAQELRVQAEAAQRQLIPFQNRRWDSDFRTACEIAASGAIGRVHRLDSQICKMRVRARDNWRNSTEAADMGGQLYDLGAHLVDQALMLMGPVVSVFATARSVRDAKEADDDTTIVLEHLSGAVSRLTVTPTTAIPAPSLHDALPIGGLQVIDYDKQEAALTAERFPEPGAAGIAAWGEQGGHAILRTCDDDSTITESRVPMARGGWPEFYDGVARCLREGAEAPVLLSDVVADMRVLDVASTSAQTGDCIRAVPPAAHLAPASA